MKRMIRVYVAGKLNDTNAVDYIKNLYRMIREGVRLRKAGFSVFIPCLDILCGIYSGDFEYKDYFDNSQPWLSHSDAVYLVPGWETSEGTKREIETAKELHIPIYEDLEKMKIDFEIEEDLPF